MRVLLAAGLLVLVTGTAGCGSTSAGRDATASGGRVTGVVQVRPGPGSPVTAGVQRVGLFRSPTAASPAATAAVGQRGGFALGVAAGRWWLSTVPPLAGTGQWVRVTAGGETHVRLLVRPEGNPR
jgi:hypothetical protein